MKIFKNIPIFQYGMSANGFNIPEETIRKNLSIFINAPVIIYNSEDPYNNHNKVIGTITAVTDIKEPFVYGDVNIFNDENIERFKNYGIQVEESHQENDMMVVDDFKLMDVGFEIEGVKS